MAAQVAPPAPLRRPQDEDDEEAELEPLMGAAGPAEAALRRRKRVYEDDFSDDPTVQFLLRMARFLYGDLPERKAFASILALAGTLAVLIGGFWLLDSVKDSIFVGTVGLRYLPWAKPVSVLVSLLAVLGYTRLTELLETPHLFTLVGAAFSLVFFVLALWLSLPGQAPSAPTPHSPTRLLGWICYCAIESFGSVAVALFWAFTNSTVDLETAKSSYGIIIALAQVGALLGASIATYASSLHSYGIFFLGSIPPITAAMLLRRIARKRGEEGGLASPSPRQGDRNPAPAAGPAEGGGSVLQAAWSGLRLVLLDPYVLGLLLVSSVSEIVLTILDFQLKAMGATETGAAAGVEGGNDLMTSFMARFGQMANLVSLTMSLLGTSLLVRRLGVRGAIMVFPMVLVGVVGVATLAHGTQAMLPFLVGGVAALKGLTYALHEPLKEMLYKPTSDEVKFKARAWIDVFASRGAKALGAAVNGLAGSHPGSAGASVSLGFSLIVAIGLAYLAKLMGRAFDHGMREQSREGLRLPSPRAGELRRDGERAAGSPYARHDALGETNEWGDYATA